MKRVLVLRHLEHESLGMLETALAGAGVDFEYVDLYRECPSDYDPTEWAGMIVLGGTMNVDQTEQYPFLKPEVEWIADAIAEGIPVLGVCLGSQLVAKALGARVYPNDRKEIGWYEIQPTADAVDADPLFSCCHTRETVFQWHGDTFDLPREAVLLATSDECRHQAFRFGETVYGLQFHLEVTGEMITSWLDTEEGAGELAELDYIDADTIRQQNSQRLTEMHGLAAQVFAPFCQLCREHA